MGLALDTVLFGKSQADSFAAATIANGDTATVRSFAAPATAQLEQLMVEGAAGSAIRITSPLLHDDVRGITITPGQQPAVYDLPPELGQPLNSQDTLNPQVMGASGVAAQVTGAYTIRYSDLTGASAVLKMWGDISGAIEQVKPLEVDTTSSATVSNWNDKVITTTEDLLKANRWYACLGYVVDVAVCAIGLKGTDTSNLRIGGPGVTDAGFTSGFFVELSNRHGTPHIPLINSANKDTTFVSVGGNAASTAVTVQLILALLAPSYTP
jgi:hypothetical protein